MKRGTWSWTACAMTLALTQASCGNNGNDPASFYTDASTANGAWRGAAGQTHLDDHADNARVDAGTHTQGSAPLNPGSDLTIAFSPMYSAYIDEDHPCKVPAIVRGVTGGVQWYASDDSMVELQPSLEGVMITTKKPGTVDIIAVAGPLSGKATLAISSFTAEEWEEGNRRYNNGIEYRAPTMQDIMIYVEDMETDGGVGSGPVVSPFTPPLNAACTNCHGDGARMLAVQHTPAQIGGYSDDDLAMIITTGTKPPGAAMTTALPAQIFRQIHTWQGVDPGTQRNGIVAYLRSLEPNTQGPIEVMGNAP